MTNVIKFPDRASGEDAEEKLYLFQERVEALSDLIDLNVQGLFQVMDVEPEEVMLALIKLGAVWSVRADIEPEEFMAFIGNIHLEVTDDD